MVLAFSMAKNERRLDVGLAFSARLPVAAIEAVPANLAPPFALSLSKREALHLRWPVHSSTSSERTGFGLSSVRSSSD